MAAKKKTKKKQVAKKSKPAKAAKSAKKASKPAKAVAKVTSKKKTVSKKAKTAPAKASKKKAEPKKANTAKVSAKVAEKKVVAKKPSKKISASSELKKSAKKKDVVQKEQKPAKVLAKKTKDGSGDTSSDKPTKKEIEKVLSAKAPQEPEVQEVEVVLTDSDGNRYCRVKDCDQLASVDAYCRYHYLLYWKKIQVRKKILTEGKLEKYIEELTAKYPDKYLDMLRKDLRSEKEFLAAIQELEIDENADDNIDEEDSQSFIEEVRGVSESGSRRDDDY